jgi:hypothetical protein
MYKRIRHYMLDLVKEDGWPSCRHLWKEKEREVTPVNFCSYIVRSSKYKVVQTWPGQTVTCLHTISPGHIWTTLYFVQPSIHELRPNHVRRGYSLRSVLRSFNNMQVFIVNTRYVTCINFRTSCCILHTLCKRQPFLRNKHSLRHTEKVLFSVKNKS